MMASSIFRFRRRNRTEPDHVSEDSRSQTQTQKNVSKEDLKRSTKSRRIVSYVAAFLLLLSIIFLIVVLLGNTRSSGELTTIYFFRLEVANIIPQSAPNAHLINSVARTLGLHDFYQVGLWNYCAGYNDEGVTSCSTPQSWYWFNPVEILTSELFAGATIALPNEVVQILDILRRISILMYGFFMSGIVLNFVMLLLSPVAVFSRWWSLPIAFLSGVNALLILLAAALATGISVAFKIAATSQQDLNIGATIGVKMFVFMWLAAGFTGIAFLLHAGLGCCGTSRRDIRTGRKEIRPARVVESKEARES